MRVLLEIKNPQINPSVIQEMHAIVFENEIKKFALKSARAC